MRFEGEDIFLFSLITIVAFAVCGFFMWLFRRSYEPGEYFYFDPQDAVRAQLGRAFPASATNATFEPILKHYIGVTQLLITVAAASIAFGGSSQTFGTTIAIAKLLLAWSIFYGVLFCALLIWRYDEYAQNIKSYTVGWYSTIFALGFSSLVCFMLGYLVWGFGLSATLSRKS